MKRTLFALALTLVLAFSATAQSDGMYDWNNTVESTYDMNNLDMFDWDEFTELFDRVSQMDVAESWSTDFRLFDFTRGSSDIEISSITNDDFVPTPLGSGLLILVGAGLGYVALKKKEDEQ